MLDFMTELKETFLDFILKILPFSPFGSIIDQLGDLPYLGYINWFIPVGTFITIGTTWLSAITTFYILSILLRWIKAID